MGNRQPTRTHTSLPWHDRQHRKTIPPSVSGRARTAASRSLMLLQNFAGREAALAESAREIRAYDTIPTTSTHTAFGSGTLHSSPEKFADFTLAHKSVQTPCQNESSFTYVTLENRPEGGVWGRDGARRERTRNQSL